MTPPTFYVDETYGPRLVGLMGEMNLHAVLGLVVLPTRLSTEDEAAHVIDKHRNSLLALALRMPPPYVISLTRQHLGFT